MSDSAPAERRKSGLMRRVKKGGAKWLSGKAIKQTIGGALKSKALSPPTSPTSAGGPTVPVAVVGPFKPLRVVEIIKTFGEAEFNAAEFLAERLKKGADINAAATTKAQLEAARSTVSEECVSTVLNHYGLFVNAARTVASIESDLGEFNTALSALRVSIDKMAATHFTYTDPSYYQRQRDEEKRLQVAVDTSLTRSLALDQWNTQLREAIYERQYGRAIKLIEQARNDAQTHASTDGTSTAAAVQIDARVSQLINTLTYELLSPVTQPTERRALIAYLTQLQRTDLARATYLQYRTDTLYTAIRELRFAGDVTAYVHSLSTTYFNLLATTATDFASLFEQSESLSALTEWAVRTVRQFGETFVRQVFHSDSRIETIGECLKHAFSACHQLETRVGLSLTFVLSDYITQPLIDHFNHRLTTVSQLLSEAIRDESWRATELIVHDLDSRRGTSGVPKKRILKLTTSAKQLYESIRLILKQLSHILIPQIYDLTFSNRLYQPTITGVINTIEQYLHITATIAHDNILIFTDDIPCLSLVANAYYLADDLLPRIHREFHRQFHRLVITEIENFHYKVGQLYEIMQDEYCRYRIIYWFNNILLWENELTHVYNAPSLATVIIPNNNNSSTTTTTNTTSTSPTPSSLSTALFSSSLSSASVAVNKPWIDLNIYLTQLIFIIEKCLTEQSVIPVIQACIEELIIAILIKVSGELPSNVLLSSSSTTASSKEKEVPPIVPTGKPQRFGLGGLVSFHRDMTYFRRFCGSFANDRISEGITSALEQSVTLYMTSVNMTDRSTVDDALRSVDEIVESVISTSQFKLMSREWEEEQQRRYQSTSKQGAANGGDREDRSDESGKSSSREKKSKKKKNNAPVPTATAEV